MTKNATEKNKSSQSPFDSISSFFEDVGNAITGFFQSVVDFFSNVFDGNSEKSNKGATVEGAEEGGKKGDEINSSDEFVMVEVEPSAVKDISEPAKTSSLGGSKKSDKTSDETTAIALGGEEVHKTGSAQKYEEQKSPSSVESKTDKVIKFLKEINSAIINESDLDTLSTSFDKRLSEISRESLQLLLSNLSSPTPDESEVKTSGSQYLSPQLPKPLFELLKESIDKKLSPITEEGSLSKSLSTAGQSLNEHSSIFSPESSLSPEWITKVFYDIFEEKKKAGESIDDFIKNYSGGLFSDLLNREETKWVGEALRERYRNQEQQQGAEVHKESTPPISPRSPSINHQRKVLFP